MNTRLGIADLEEELLLHQNILALVPLEFQLVDLFPYVSAITENSLEALIPDFEGNVAQKFNCANHSGSPATIIREIDRQTKLCEATDEAIARTHNSTLASKDFCRAPMQNKTFVHVFSVCCSASPLRSTLEKIFRSSRLFLKCFNGSILAQQALKSSINDAFFGVSAPVLRQAGLASSEKLRNEILSKCGFYKEEATELRQHGLAVQVARVSTLSYLSFCAFCAKSTPTPSLKGATASKLGTFHGPGAKIGSADESILQQS